MRISDLRFLVAWLLPLMSIYGLLTTPHLTAMWVGIFWLLVISLDAFVPGGKSSPAALKSTDNLGYFSWVLRVYVVLQLAKNAQLAQFSIAMGGLVFILIAGQFVVKIRSAGQSADFNIVRDIQFLQTIRRQHRNGGRD